MATLTSPEAMQAWGRRLAGVLKAGDVVALVGDLGAGKTTLVQGIAAGWGYRRRANSPTFALVNEYHGARGALLHMDMYRLSLDEAAAFPLHDHLEEPAVAWIGWAARIRDHWPPETLEIQFKAVDPGTRKITVQATSAAWRKRLSRLTK